MRIEYKANRSQRTVRDSVGNALVSRGIARRVDEPRKEEPATAPESSAMEPEQAKEISPRTGKPKRRYKRRDMKAEE